MENFKKGEIAFNENKYEESLHYLQKELQEKNLTKIDKKKIYQYLFKIVSLLKNEISFEKDLLDYVEILSLDGEYSEAIKILNCLILVDKLEYHGRTLFYLHEVHFKAGKIEVAKEYGKQLLCFYLRKKDDVKGLSFVQTYNSYYGQDDLVSEAEQLLYFLRGNYSKFDSLPGYNLLIEKLFCNTFKLKESKKNIEELLDNYQIEESDLLQSETLGTLFLIRKINKFFTSKADEFWSLAERENFLSYTYKFLICFPQNIYGYFSLLVYSLSFKKKEMGASVKAFLYAAKEFILPSRSCLHELNSALTRIESLVPEEIDLEELEEDLEKILSEEEEIDKEESAIDGDSDPLISNSWKVDSPFDNRSDDNKIIEENLRQFIVSWLKNRGGASFHPTFETRDFSAKEILTDFGADILTCFSFLDMPDISLEIINAIEQDIKLGVEEKINLYYLKAINYMRLARWTDALIVIDEVLWELPLLDDDKVCFMYIKAETLREQKNLKDAYTIYKSLKDIRPKYRLVENRIKEIENNK